MHRMASKAKRENEENEENEIYQTPKSLVKCLTECQIGEEVTVLHVNTGYKQKRRLANLGIVPGTRIKKRNNAPFRGPIEIIVKGSSLVIGRGLASKITVQCDKSCNL